MKAQDGRACLLARDEACALLGGISMASLKRRIRDGDIAVVKVGRRTMIEPEVITAYIARQRRVGEGLP